MKFIKDFVFNRTRLDLVYADLQGALAANKRLVADVEALEMELEELEKVLPEGTACVEAVMDRDINWFDYHALDFDTKLTYYNDAQSLLQNPTLRNECDRLKADWARFCMAEAKDFGTVRDMRMCVNALELLMERVGSIEDPRKKESKIDLHADL